LRFSVDEIPQYEPGFEQEPTIEKGKDRFRFWWKVLVAVIVAGILIGFAASESYNVYPYTVHVGGTFIASDGSRAQLLGMTACDEYLYANTTCPDPGLAKSWDCLAPEDMNLGEFCNVYNLEANPGHYQITLRNGEDYSVVAYMVTSSGGFDKICSATIHLSPQLTSHNSTQNFGC